MASPSVEIKFTKIFINNEWHDSVSGKTFPVVNPATEQVIANVQEGDKADVDKAVKAARAAFQLNSAWRQADASQRGRWLFALSDLIEREKDYLSRLESIDNGKPLAEASFDIDCAVATLRYYAGWADKTHGQTIPADGFGSQVVSFTQIEPVGVCAQIIPWNYPALMLAWKWAPALAAGCTVVLKPAEQTPLSALYIANLSVEAGFPPGVISVIPGYGPTAGAALVTHPGVDKIAFTGSTEIGKTISIAAGNSLKRVTLELGGKSPLVVTGSVAGRLAEAAQIAHDACFANQGQCCCAGTRTYVHDSIYDQFVLEAAKIAKQKVIGDPFDGRTTQGPQIDSKQTEKIINLIEAGKREGARVLTGGARAARKGYFIEPTVFADVRDDMRIAREEIFGPVQQIIRYRTLEEVIERCNDSRYGLAAGILTDDINEAMRFSRSVQAGSVWVNCYDHTVPQTPFGGFKQSGNGRELGEEGLRAYCEVKTVTIKLR